MIQCGLLTLKAVPERQKTDGRRKVRIEALGNSGLAQRAEELERENAALRDALAAAEEANRAKSRFLSSMSHDIRTPMNAIMSMTAIGLSHIDEKARVQDCLDKIRTASAHLMSLVNDVLDISRINSGRMTLSEERFSLADLVHDVAVIVRVRFAQRPAEEGSCFTVELPLRTAAREQETPLPAGAAVLVAESLD